MDWSIQHDAKTGASRVIFSIEGMDYIIPFEETIIKRLFNINDKFLHTSKGHSSFKRTG